MSVDSTTETRPRVVVLALSYRPQQRVQNYVSELVAAGVDVDLVLAEAKSTEDLELDPRVHISTVMNAELRDVPLRRYERALVFQLPAKIIGKAQSLTSGRKVLTPLDRTISFAGRGQKWVSRGVHGKLFWPAFRVLRPWILVRRGRGPVEALDLAGADRIVAADTAAIPLAWRLAKRYPEVRATTALDRKPYLAEKLN
jgi:hypothetical protein